MIFHLTTGLPGSGKTSHARTLEALRFSLDDYRAMMDSGSAIWAAEGKLGQRFWDNGRERIAVTAMIASLRAALLAGYDVVADNTHIVPRLPLRYRQEFSDLELEFQVHDFTSVSVDECIKRDAERLNSVGAKVIYVLAGRYNKAREEGWQLTNEWMNGVAVSNV